jgi:transcriptional regulator with XRE-family HTH domain
VTDEVLKLEMRATVLGLVRSAMDAEGVSQAELARRVGDSRSNVNHLLRGRRRPSLAKLAGILEALGYDLVIEARKKQPECVPGYTLPGGCEEGTS